MIHRKLMHQPFEQWFQSGDAILIDMREPDEFASGHIEARGFIPFGRVSANL